MYLVDNLNLVLSIVTPLPQLLSLILNETNALRIDEILLLTTKVQDLAKKLLPLMEGLDILVYGEITDLLLQTAKKFPNDASLTIPVLKTMITIANKHAFFDPSKQRKVWRFARRYADEYVGTTEHELGSELLRTIAPGWLDHLSYNTYDYFKDNFNILSTLFRHMRNFSFCS